MADSFLKEGFRKDIGARTAATEGVTIRTWAAPDHHPACASANVPVSFNAAAERLP